MTNTNFQIIPDERSHTLILITDPRYIKIGNISGSLKINNSIIGSKIYVENNDSIDQSINLKDGGTVTLIGNNYVDNRLIGYVGLHKNTDNDNISGVSWINSTNKFKVTIDNQMFLGGFLGIANNKLNLEKDMKVETACHNITEKYTIDSIIRTDDGLIKKIELVRY